MPRKPFEDQRLGVERLFEVGRKQGVNVAERTRVLVGKEERPRFLEQRVERRPIVFRAVAKHTLGRQFYSANLTVCGEERVAWRRTEAAFPAACECWMNRGLSQ